jgi:GNAT superfamily N-acetyltransferase
VGSDKLTELGALRPADEGDLTQLIALRERTFRQRISPEQWRWKLGHPRGPVANVWVVEARGRLVFQYAGIPTPVRHLGTDSLAMVSVDTMTDPDYRRRGLLTKMGAETYAHWRRAGVAFVLGIPNEQWGSRSAALGFVPVSELRWWVRWIDPLRMLAMSAGLQRAKPSGESSEARWRFPSLEVSPVTDPSPFDDLWRRTGNEGVIRDAGRFRWRYLEAVPAWNVLGAWRERQVVGAVAFRLNGNLERSSGTIGEVVAPELSSMRALLKAACASLRRRGAVRVALLIQPDSLLEQAALATGFLPRRFAFSVQAIDLGGGLPRAGHFQGGDFDVV